MIDSDDRRRRLEDDPGYRDELRAGEGRVAPAYDEPDVRPRPEYEEPRRVDESRVDPDEGMPSQRQQSHLFAANEVEDFRVRWDEIQTNFVDDPRNAVKQADRLVREVTDGLNEMFSSSRNELEKQWSAGKDASTEDLRRAMQRYRSFFQRLLSL